MPKVYLVEDEYDLANLVVKYLLKDGYDVERFCSGEEALSHIKDKVDLWILDIMLPGSVNGYDLIKEIKENRIITNFTKLSKFPNKFFTFVKKMSNE